MLNSLREKRNKLKDEQISLQALSQMKARQQEIDQQIDKVAGELRGIESSLEPLKRQLSEAVERKQQTKDENKKKLTDAMNKLNDIKPFVAELKRYISI